MSGRRQQRVLDGQLALTGIPVLTDTRVPVSTRVPVPSERSDRSSSALVLTGTAVVPSTSQADWYRSPLKGCGYQSQPACTGFRAHADRPVSPCFAGSDVLGLSATLLPSLPLRVCLVGRSEYDPVRWHVSTSRAVWLALRRRRQVVFGVLEWQAIVSSFGNYRARPADFVDWCRAKAVRATWKVTTRDTLGRLPASSVVPSSSASVGAVLAGFGLVLEAVWYGDELPVPAAVPVPVKGGAS